jgi:hypothetical protein
MAIVFAIFSHSNVQKRDMMENEDVTVTCHHPPSLIR